LQAPITFTAVITPGEDGWFLAQVPDVREAISQGRTAEEARNNVSGLWPWHFGGVPRREKSSLSPGP